MNKKLLRHINKRLDVLKEYAIAYASAKSVVDDRQPFFKSGKKLLTVNEKLGLLAH